jgi:hypothetical protein
MHPPVGGNVLPPSAEPPIRISSDIRAVFATIRAESLLNGCSSEVFSTITFLG